MQLFIKPSGSRQPNKFYNFESTLGSSSSHSFNTHSLAIAIEYSTLIHLFPTYFVIIKMKTFTISAVLVASANSVLAQDQYYNLVASAPGAAFDAALLKPYDRYWHIGVEANSTCGDVAPGVAVISENLVVYNDGRSHQQYGKLTYTETMTLFETQY